MDHRINIEYTENETQSENSIVFDIKGDKGKGLNKSVINSLRRVLLSAIPTVGFLTELNNTDIKILKNTTSLHNEFILHRLSMIPLYIDPQNYNRNYLFKLKIENNIEKPLIKVTAKDFDIFTLKEGEIIDEDNTIDLEKYNTTPISEKEKQKIFRPFNKKHYCEIIELKSSDSTLKEELDLYGIPRISFAYEDSRWQAVSCATYSFKKDKELFNQILQDKLKIDNISEEDRYNYSNSLFISESERYFHRDLKCEPYWYEFKIESLHHLNSKNLFIKSCEIIIDELELLKQELPKVLDDESNSRFSIEKISENIFKLFIHGNDDTIGNILQTYIVNELINKDNSKITVCGYKNIHPLEKILCFNISLNLDMSKKSNQRDIINIIELFTDACEGLIYLYSSIKKAAQENL